jgi:hypothetical protein
MTDAAPISLAKRPTPLLPRSKMLDMYAGDIARMLDEGRHEDAERAALGIPHICVALADADLQSSCAAYESWCSRWVQPNFGELVYRDWCTRSGECEIGAPGVPFAALRALRLRRWAREVPPPMLEPEAPNTPHTPQGATTGLLRAALRWYEQEGRYHSLVQTNLARLGVLR